MKKRTKIAGIAGIAIAAIVPTLIGGDPAPKDKYPSTVRIFSGGSCTATLVGPQVVLSAAHCMDDGMGVEFDYNGARIKSNACDHHPGYADNQTKDFALCWLSEPLTGTWETINTDHGLVSKGDTVTLTGYGCTEEGGGGGNDGILREGSAKVTKTPSRNNFDIVTSAAKGALCFGDSGGPAFYSGDSGRVVIGVNSRGNIKDTSYLSAVHMADQNFMKKWSEKRKLGICGVTLDKGCRSVPKKKEDPGFNLEKILEILQKLLDILADFFADPPKDP